MFLIKVCNAFKKSKIPYAVVGGYAVALHGCVRGTVDIDFVTKLTRGTLMKVESTLNTLGLVSRLPVKAEDIYEFREEYIKNRNLIAWNFYNPNNPTESVDILITHSLDELQTVDVTVERQKIKIAALDDLIKMKSAAGREQDIEDIKALKALK